MDYQFKKLTQIETKLFHSYYENILSSYYGVGSKFVSSKEIVDFIVLKYAKSPAFPTKDNLRRL